MASYQASAISHQPSLPSSLPLLSKHAGRWKHRLHTSSSSTTSPFNSRAPTPASDCAALFLSLFLHLQFPIAARHSRRPRDLDSIHPVLCVASGTMKTTAAPFLYVPLLLAHLASAVSIDCEHVRVDGKKFDLSKLAGRHSVIVNDLSRPPAEYNTTWTLNLCAPLKKISGVRDEDQCPSGTRGKQTFRMVD